MKQPNISVYGSRTCPDTVRTTAFLDAHQIPYEFKDVDATPEYNTYIASLNGGKRVMPTLRIDNQSLINPSEAELKEAVSTAASAR
jgi:glutaredoxin